MCNNKQWNIITLHANNVLVLYLITNMKFLAVSQCLKLPTHLSCYAKANKAGICL